MNEYTRKKISRFMALVLRHEASSFGLFVDKDGYVGLSKLAQVLVQKRLALSNTEATGFIREVVAKCDKQRYEISGSKIRAKYGHSDAKVAYKEIVPPDVLYHGTATKAFDKIKKDGLMPMRRQYVHLSLNEATAMSVGTRHGTPVVLEIDAKKAHKEGVKFYSPDNVTYLVTQLPSKYIKFNEPVYGRFATIARL